MCCTQASRVWPYCYRTHNDEALAAAAAPHHPQKPARLSDRNAHPLRAQLAFTTHMKALTCRSFRYSYSVINKPVGQTQHTALNPEQRLLALGEARESTASEAVETIKKASETPSSMCTPNVKTLKALAATQKWQLSWLLSALPWWLKACQAVHSPRNNPSSLCQCTHKTGTDSSSVTSMCFETSTPPPA